MAANTAAHHIVHFSSVHRAQDTRILHRECRTLAEAGFRVTLIANAPSDFVEHGVKVRALPVQSGNRFRRMTTKVWRTFQMARAEKADLYHFHDPELIPAGLLLRLTGAPVIYDVHESISLQILSKHWIPFLVRRPVALAYRIIERLVGRVFSAVVVATPAIAQYFPDDRVVVVQNFPILDELVSRGQAVGAVDSSPHTICYVGGITAVRGLREMMAAIALLPETMPVELVLAGPVTPQSLVDEAASWPGSDRTKFAGVLGREEVADLLSRSTLGLCVLHPEPNYLDSFPVKLFEYMAAGLPVVTSEFPFWRQFVLDTGAGMMVDPLNPKAISEAMTQLLGDPEAACRMGEAGEKAVRARFNWGTEAEKLVALYRRLLGDS